MHELTIFVALGVFVPIIGAILFAIWLRRRLLNWSIARKAVLAATPLGGLLAAFGALFVFSGYVGFKHCPATSVCDAPGMAIAMGMMILMLDVISFVLASLAAFITLQSLRSR